MSTPQPRPPREVDLILHCARLHPGPGGPDRLRELLAGELDWDLVFRTAQSHGVAPLLWWTLSRLVPEAVPPRVLGYLAAQIRANVRSNLVLAAELLQLLRQFQARDLRVIAIKGPALAQAVYGDLSLRKFGDLDLLVHPGDARRAQDLLLALGFRLGWHQRGWEYHFEHGTRDLVVDLHERIAANYYPMPARFDALWQRRQQVRIGGGAVPTVGAEDLLLILNVQLAKDCRRWKQRLIQVCDMAELIRGNPGMDWSFVLDAGRAARAERIVLLTLRLTQLLLDVELPPAVHAGFRSDPMVDRLASEVKARFFPEVDGSRTALDRREDELYVDSLFHLRTRERWRDKLNYVRLYSLLRCRRVVTPGERDRRFLALPGSLGFLYYLVRPVRVASDLVLRRGRFGPAAR